MVLCGVGFFFYLAYSFITAGSEPAATGRPTTVQSVPRQTSSSTDSSAPTTPSPAETSNESAEPTTPPSTTPAKPGGKGTVLVPGPNGTDVPAPVDSVNLAKLSFQSLYNSAAAQRVPTSTGGIHEPPASPGNGSYTNLIYASAADGDLKRLTFTADVDPDGPTGEAEAALVPVTVALQNGSWVFVDTAG